ncbi:MAG: pilus assembly protein N-terminal domain-containing protein [Acidobacteriota bacterium]
MTRLGALLAAAALVVAGNVMAARAPKTNKAPQPVPAPKAEEPGAIQKGETVHVRVGSGNVLTFPSRVIRVALGDEKIVAIHVVEARQVLLQGLAPGRSSAYVWMADGRRLRYELIVSPRLEALEAVLAELDPHIALETSGDGSTLVLTGKVKDERVVIEARRLADEMLGASGNASLSRVVNLLQFPGSNEADFRLTAALAAVDPRIRLRRMQVGAKTNNAADAVVLEGNVKDVSSLVRAMTLAELQLGGIGGKIEPLDGTAFQGGRNRNFSGSSGLQQGLQGSDSPPSGLAAYVARGLVLKSASGRVLSFLEVDELPQIMVSIRVLQIDRGRARRLGIDYRLDAEHLSVGSVHQPGRTEVGTPPSTPSVAGLLGGNIVASFVDKTLAVVAAIDLLQQRDVARSVAEPNITTLSGESASVLVGGEVPIPTTTVGQNTSVQGFLFQDFGVRLDIRPTLAPSGLVAMEISPSIIRPTADLSVSGVPGFQVQSVQTTAKVAPGQSLVIGGLISFEEELKKRGVPGLSEIPVMKHLFSWEGRTLQEQEILFVITPRILDEGPGQLADAIQWRDVTPLPPGTTVELPAIDLDTARAPQPGTLGRDGLPPSFTNFPAVPPAAPITPMPRVTRSTAPPLATATIAPGLRASLTSTFAIEVIALPHKGDAWTRLAKRLTADAGNWRQLAELNGTGESLTSEARIRVPFAMLRPELQKQIKDALLPRGSAHETAWRKAEAERTASR